MAKFKEERRMKKMEPASINIRRMTKDDLDSIIDVDKKVTGRERVPSWPQKVSTHFKIYYPPLCFVAEVEKEVVAFILGDIRGAEYGLPLAGWIDIIGVDPEYQGQGAGRRLIEAFSEECSRIGIKSRAMVREHDERIQKFLSSAGFQRGLLVEFVK